MSAMEIGAWDVEKAVPMELIERQEGEDKWCKTVEFPTATNTLEYKYVVKHKHTQELISWEGLPGNRTLTVAPGTNVALGAPAAQSSTYTTSRAPAPGPRGAELGNNGSTNGFLEWRCCRTNKETNPWWEVDLGRDYAISSIHVWNAMTYHEQARHPDGRPPVTSKASTSSPAPPLWVFVSKEPLDRGQESYSEAQAKAAADPSSVRAIEVKSLFDSRVRSLNSSVESISLSGVDPLLSGAQTLPTVKGRYVRLQYASTSCALQFAELEVVTQDSPIAVGGESLLKHDDGFYGVANALDADLQEYVETGWLDPAANVAELQVWVGSFQTTKPAIQWVGIEPESNRVAIEMRHEKQMQKSNQAELQDQNPQKLPVTWESLPVESKCAALLDKESTELRQILESYQQLSRADISAYLNNDPKSASAEQAPSTLPWLSRLTFVKTLEKSDVEALTGRIVTRKYKKGDSIVHYAEQKRAVFYVESGSVELFGPESSTGTNVIGSVEKDSFFNEMGLFSRWSKQPALFRAKDDVICQVFELETLLETLGKNKVASIRDSYIRSRCKVIPPSDNKKVHNTDATHAQVFQTKVPAPVVNGSSQGLAHRWTFDIYDCQKDRNSGVYVKTELLGSAYLLPSQLDQHGEADLTVPILSSKVGIVGQLTLSYLVLTPFIHPKNNIANVWRSYWRERPPLTIGHRGMGRSYYQVDGYRLALTRENTLASLILAGRSGADFVEFDVQLTKDRVPVIYHDFLVNVGLEDKSAGSFGTKPETYEIGIHDMSFRQLTQSYTTPVPHKGSKSQVLQSRLKKHWARLQGDKQVPSPRRGPLTDDSNASEEGHLVDFFPRLEDLLKHVPAEVGLNIEVKYPDNFFRTAMRDLSCFAINAYIDRVLQCVFDCAGSRRIFFSCFDPSVCIALRAKQAKYPVLFLTYGSMAPQAMDARMTLQFAVNLAKMEKLQGIVSNSNSFLETPELAPLVKKELGTVLITWGDQNTNHEMVQLQKRHAIDGVISDNVIDLINQDKKLLAQAK
ncbi:Glycerophosphocholine phosphodiesterase GPCPD1 [Phytophthora citrophthora]|uniref:Glycerophosphocholine phosphodiesterase GPCPD1 n=1 Tax=Phytophthora citrophthora TaxID=4793 RepID=A0AAD9G057_9STRA|nr:Glycerophosphocholine phosphodiesterase GPCPD1 [Phytophthora citrophthora]